VCDTDRMRVCVVMGMRSVVVAVGVWECVCVHTEVARISCSPITLSGDSGMRHYITAENAIEKQSRTHSLNKTVKRVVAVCADSQMAVGFV